MTFRLDALVARFAPMSRSEAARVIRAGRVRVSGDTIRTPDARVLQEAALELDGEALDTRGERHIMLHKPTGVLTAASDPRAPTVMALLPAVCASIGCMPVGRLDKDTSGLLVFTTDGVLAHRLLSPARDVQKEYKALVSGHMTREDALAFERGIPLKDFTCRPARLELVSQAGDDDLVTVTVHEGRYHQVRRMLAARGHEALSLHRTRFGPLTLDGLEPGAWRELTKDEVSALRDAAFSQKGETP